MRIIIILLALAVTYVAAISALALIFYLRPPSGASQADLDRLTLALFLDLRAARLSGIA